MAQPDWSPIFEPYAERIVNAYNCPGLSLAVAKAGEPLYWYNIGDRDREAGLPMTPDSLMGIGSCTKSVTCVAIMQLQEAGKLSVHDPVIRHLSGFGLPDEDLSPLVTIHHLMTHTAGFPSLPSGLACVARSAQGDPSLPLDWSRIQPLDTHDQLIAFLKRFPYLPIDRPGRQFSYSNEGYGLLGAIISAVSGQPYEQYVTEHILQPAGMTSTTWGLLPDVDTAVPYAALPTGQVIRAGDWWTGGPITAAGFLRSTVRDLLRYMELFRTGGRVGEARILTAESVQAMLQPYAYVDDGLWYGYGLAHRPDYHGMTVIEHGGSVKGVSAHIILIPEAEWTGAVLANLQGVPTGAVLLGALNAAASIPVESRWTSIERGAPELPLADYTGTYETDDGVTMTVTVDGEGLAFAASGMAAYRATLFPTGGHRFAARVRESDDLIIFLADAGRGVWGLLQGLRVLRRVNAC